MESLRTIVVVGSVSIASSGLYAFLVTAGVKIIFDLDDNQSMLWVGVPIFLALLPVHIKLLPKELRKGGFID